MISAYLKDLKNKKNLTNQELSDLSGVPIGTINRIMSGQTDNPSFQTVCDIVMAMDGSLDELVGIKPESETTEKTDHASHLSAEMLMMYRHIIATKDRWLFRLFLFSCFMVAFVLFVLVYDIFNPSVGFFLR